MGIRINFLSSYFSIFKFVFSAKSAISLKIPFLYDLSNLTKQEFLLMLRYRQEFCVREYSQIRFFNLGGGV